MAVIIKLLSFFYEIFPRQFSQQEVFDNFAELIPKLQQKQQIPQVQYAYTCLLKIFYINVCTLQITEQIYDECIQNVLKYTLDKKQSNTNLFYIFNMLTELQKNYDKENFSNIIVEREGNLTNMVQTCIRAYEQKNDAASKSNVDSEEICAQLSLQMLQMLFQLNSQMLFMFQEQDSSRMQDQFIKSISFNVQSSSSIIALFQQYISNDEVLNQQPAKLFQTIQ